MGNVCSISISLDDVISRCWNCTTKQAKYVSELEENLDALRTALAELRELRNDVKRKIEIAEEQQMKRLDQVQGWLLRVEAMEIEVNQLIVDGTQEIETKCLGGCCPKNCKSSYKLGKKVIKRKDDVAALQSQGHFQVVADRLPLAQVNERPSEPSVGLESTFDEVWSYIGDEQVGIIGLYGMGGVGKTTLLTKINNNFCNTTHSFDRVIWVVVSKNLDPIKIQEDIGKIIGLYNNTWKSKTQAEKAADIFEFLKNKKFVMLLDDIWERLDLLKVGIPLPSKQNKSKIVLTTRSVDVCGRMEAHKKIKVKCLAWEEAWGLFQEKVGKDTLNAHPEIPKLAEIVVRECGGLPLALITIGRAMACKMTPQGWHHAIEVLKKSAAEFSGLGDEVFPLLKFSYDSLKNDTVKSCFLYCSLFPEDSKIPTEKMIGYWIGEGFLDEFDDFNGTQNQGHDIIDTLTNACLLERDLSMNVKMHDVLRDMALWIACRYGEVKDKVLVQAQAGLKKAPKVGKWKEVERMSLMGNWIEELEGTPLCPNLLTLFLNGNRLKTIASGFFHSMPNLRVLDLSNNGRLDMLPAEISQLVSLQYLNLSHTNITELPVEFKNLVELKYLDLDYTTGLRIIPKQVLSSFKKLRVLRMFECGSFDSLKEDSVLFGDSEALVKELECLEDLKDLSTTIRSNSALLRFQSSPKLLSCTSSLRLCCFKGSKHINVSFLESMRRLDRLDISSCKDLEGMIVERARGRMANSATISRPCFHSLQSVYINRCPSLKEVAWLLFAPNIHILEINYCKRMEEVICVGNWGEAAHDGGNLEPFARLHSLRLSHLPELKSIYPNALPLSFLISAEVDNCPQLNKLPLDPQGVYSFD